MKKIDLSRLRFFDGAMGTRLFEMGYPFGPRFEEINITHPEAVQAVHRSYVEAGADFITTNTFAINPLKMAGSRYTVRELVSAAVRNAKEAAQEHNYIVLDIGPCGKMLEPYGDLTVEEAYGSFKEIIAIAKDDVDAILFETFMDLDEIKAGIKAAKETCDLPIFATMTFESKGRTLMGVDVETMVAELEAMGVSALGVNCSLGPIELLSVVKELTEISKLPILVQPNAGLPHVHPDGSLHYDISAQAFADAVEPFIQRGVCLIGGCCGTDAETIKELKQRFQPER
jgi:5-methyltetrahydrofolate--homocysteine methyltransferase